MSLTHRTLAVCLSTFLGLFVVFFFAPNAWAQDRHVIDRSAVQRAVSAKAQADEADRAALLRAVHSPEAQAVAERFGLTLTRVDDAVATMSPAEVHALVGPALAATSSSGGNTIVISTTTLLLLLILVVLLVH
jgi:hypothetical protein